MQRGRVDEDREACTHDILVVGGSAGAVEATRSLAARLPADLPAAVFVAIHRSSEGPAYLADLLGAAGPLPALPASEGMPVQRGHIYVAPPDHHLLVGRDHVHVRRGPKENRTRPAIDPLFRSAAVNATTRVIGLLLSGSLDDGTAGLLAIRRCGGVAVVQDPKDARFGEMPASAIANGAVDHVGRLAELPDLLARLTRYPCPGPVDPPEELRMEALIAAQELRMRPDNHRLGKVSSLTCPECHGALTEIDDQGFLRFRCHTGHAYSAESLRSSQADAWERALYDALRAQEEQLLLLRKMALDARSRGQQGHAQGYETRAQSYEEGVQIIRSLLVDNGPRVASDDFATTDGLD
jgi:two-component system, chemotaxis family, protein-glutamate methylesterase/glutaminase